MQKDKDVIGRRSMLAGLGVAAIGGIAASACAEDEKAGFEPARNQRDAWFDELPGDHRVFIDSATGNGGAEACLFARNILSANKNAYAGKDSDYAMIVGFRHFATVFGFVDSVWEKYGEAIQPILPFNDPKTGAAPKINLMRAADRTSLPNAGVTIDALIDRGVQFAICDNATHFFSRFLASKGFGEAEDIYKELRASPIPQSRFVSAGVMALTRAQEYGYSVVNAG